MRHCDLDKIEVVVLGVVTLHDSLHTLLAPLQANMGKLCIDYEFSFVVCIKKLNALRDDADMFQGIKTERQTELDRYT